MKLPKGPLKVIFTNPLAPIENDARNRVGGKRFMPTIWVVMENPDGPKPLTYQVFGVAGRLRARTSVGTFPHAKVLPVLKDMRVWFETTEELHIQTTYEESNG